MRCVAYVDGSFSMATNPANNEKVGVYGSGIYMTLEGKSEPIELSFGGADPDFSSMRNVAGEIIACTTLVTLMQEELPQYKQLDIYYDFEGIEHWVTGKWKANKVATIAYRDIMREAQKKMVIRFYWIESHTGVIYNERADSLAKKGVEDTAADMGLVL